MIRRLTPDDADLLREACAWDEDRPLWYRQMDAVFNSGPVEQLIEKLGNATYWFVGVFNPALEAIVIVENHGQGLFEGHLMARRGANGELIAATIQQLLYDLTDCGLGEAFVWVAARHLSVRQICSSIGLVPDGIVMYKGAYRGRVIRWLRHSIRREELLIAKAA